MSALVAEPREALLTSSRGASLNGDIAVPGDKSMSHRALILGGLAKGETRISGLLEGDDVLHTADAVRALGAIVERLGAGEWRVQGAEWRSPANPLDCGNSGTAARLLMGAVAGFPISVTFTGDKSLSGRPMERVLAPLRSMGARTRNGALPVTIEGGGLNGIRFVNERASAQVKSAILFAGLRAKGAVEVIEPAPSRDHSEHMLRAFGCEIESHEGVIRLGANRRLTGTSVPIPADPSSAAFPIVAALITSGSTVTVRNVMVSKLRAGLSPRSPRWVRAFVSKMSAKRAARSLPTSLPPARHCVGVEVPAERAPSMIDEYPILSIAAAFSSGRTVMHGLSELRVKESNRLAAIIAGLRASGVDAREEGDSLIVEGRGRAPDGGAIVRARSDHRIAMSFLVMGLATERLVSVDSGSMIATSFPDFLPLMRSLGARIG